MISETFYLLNLIAKLSPILLLYLCGCLPRSTSITKCNKQVKHGSEFTWLCAFTSMGYVQLELTVLTIFLVVFVHVNGTTSEMTSVVCK